MIPALITGASAVASAVGGGLLGNSAAKKEREFNAKEAQKNRDFQREERELAQQWELDMWNMNNDYNDIGSQIERARAAGVNPAAIIGGDYKPVQSDALSTTPMSGTTASTGSGGALGSSFISNAAPLLNAATNGAKALVDAKATDELIDYNKRHLDSLIEVNRAQIIKFAHENNLTDVNIESIRKSISWMDGLNDAEIKLKSAQATKFYNDNFETFQRIRESEQRIAESEQRVKESKQNILESRSRIAVNDAQAQYTSTLSEYQSTVNKYADGIQEDLAIQEDVKSAEAVLRKEWAKLYNIPLDSPEFIFSWELAKQGKYEEYCNKVIQPSSRATWKPSDMFKDVQTPSLFFPDFNGRRSYKNPSPSFPRLPRLR